MSFERNEIAQLSFFLRGLNLHQEREVEEKSCYKTFSGTNQSLTHASFFDL